MQQSTPLPNSLSTAERLEKQVSRIQKFITIRDEYIREVDSIEETYNNKFQNTMEDIMKLYQRAIHISEEIGHEQSMIIQYNEKLENLVNTIFRSVPQLEKSQIGEF